MINILRNITTFKSFQVIGVFLYEDRKDVFILDLKKASSTLLITGSRKFSDIEQALPFLDQKKPVLLLIDGKGVLNKKIDYSNENDLVWLKNFDYQVVHHFSIKTQNYTFISFCRKKVADDIIHLLSSKKIAIADFYIGSIISALMRDLIQEKSILSNETYLHFENGALFDLSKLKEQESETNYTIGAVTVTNRFIPLYSIGLNLYVKDSSIMKSDSDFIDKDELIYKRAFDKLALYSILIFFTALLLSYLTINFYTQKNVDLNMENLFSNQTYQMTLDLERQHENKMTILNETGSLSSNFLSYYTKELTTNIPSAITLTGLTICPLQKDIKNKERISFDYTSILVKGFFEDEISFNTWIESIKKFGWVKSSEILYLKQDKKNKLHFELKIKI